MAGKTLTLSIKIALYELAIATSFTLADDSHPEISFGQKVITHMKSIINILTTLPTVASAPDKTPAAAISQPPKARTSEVDASERESAQPHQGETPRND